MTVLFITNHIDSRRGRLLASFPGTPDDLRAATEGLGASLGPLDEVLRELERQHVISVASFRTTLQALLERVQRHRAAQGPLYEPYDPEDPRCPADEREQNERAWFLFKQGDKLVLDLECIIGHLAVFDELGVEEIVVSGYR